MNASATIGLGAVLGCGLAMPAPASSNWRALPPRVRVNPFLNSLCPLLIAALVVLTGPQAHAAPAGDGRPAPSVWARAYAYGEATAHEPDFWNRDLWPYLTGKEYFLKTPWPKVRTLVWSQPGVSAHRRTNLDPLDPKNWTDLESGQPANALPDANTDVILPAAEKRYVVDWQNAGHGHEHWGPPLEARSVTVSSNADFRISDAKVRGNVWVQRGGFFLVDVTFFLLGSDHTFFRNDNTCVRPGTGDGAIDGTYLCQYLKFNKASREASTEFLGMLHTGDEFQIERGTLIVGSDSVLEMGRECSPYLEKDACIALLDNAYLGKWTIDFHCTDLEVRGGTLQAGLPDRPLSRSATFRISHKNHTAANYHQPVSQEEGERIPNHQLQRVVGMVLQSGSTLRSFSSDMARAHLIIKQLPPSYPITFQRPALGTAAYEEMAKDSLRQAYLDWLDRLPRGIDIAVNEKVRMNGVEFDCLRKGGLIVWSQDERMQWQNVFWGENNLGPVDQLIGKLPREALRGNEY